MGVVESTLQFLGSLRVIDDLEDDLDDPRAVSVRGQVTGRNARRRRDSPGPQVSAQREENKTLKRRLERLERHLASARRDAEHNRERRGDSETQRAQLEERNKELETVLDNLRASYEQEIDNLRQQREAYMAEHPTSTPQQARQPTAHSSSSEGESNDRGRAHIDLLRQLHERNEEVHALRLYLDENDEISAAELVQMVRDLNAEVRALAAALTDAVTFATPWDIEDAPFAIEAAEPVLEGCLNMLVAGDGRGALDHAADPTLVQLALQAWIVHCCAMVFERFCFGLPDDLDEVLTRLYAPMQRDGRSRLSSAEVQVLIFCNVCIEPQAAAARWRALSRVYSKAAIADYSACQQDAVRQLATLVFSGSTSILRFAGARNTHGMLASVLGGVFGVRVESIVYSATAFAEAMRERVLSAAYDVVLEAPGMSFDEAIMESIDTTAARVSAEQDEADAYTYVCEVVCTVGFGLRSTRRRVRSSPTVTNASETAGTGTVAVTSSAVLVRPEVVLSSTLEALRRRYTV